ncbi:glycosyltransferase [Flavobacterium sp. RSP49]|uniref:glycosyltransferase family 4 protein n=1 Tax=Flavobacterium sp. RSP49 TaxID=2497487 RepID=UPI000F8490D0|nr:glycosyltransferase family 4 protein [Flavobacterium sp. RSP49]RTZ00894.1 glycosyltransferase [Flavobacterium sp. RSP49]
MKYIVVHAGRRDDYQVALALAEENSLQFLVTDFYTPFDTNFLGSILKFLPVSMQRKLAKRYKMGLSSNLVRISYLSMFYEVVFLFSKSSKYSALKDKALGNLAKRLSVQYQMPILSMNTYAKYAFQNNPVSPKVLFQFHPHTTFVKNILNEEIKINPISKKSLLQEYEFSVSDLVLENLTQEIHLAEHIICASTITAVSLQKEGISKDIIKVIPYGVDTTLYPYKKRDVLTTDSTFKVVFIGSLNQRKGITYLLEALESIPNVELNIVTRGIFDINLLKKYRVKVNLYKNIPHVEMVSILHSSHCFVLPSLIEGFGQVILEAMATGIPIIASENTIAPDIIKDGENGFVVPVRNVIKIKEKIELLVKNPELIGIVGNKGYQTSVELSWQIFRTNIVNHLKQIAK